VVCRKRSGFDKEFQSLKYCDTIFERILGYENEGESILPTPVLLCRIDGNFGGVERNLLSLAQGLDPNQFPPIVVTLAYPGELARLARQAGIPTEFIPMRSRLDIVRAGRRLIEIAERRGAGLVHTFGIRSNTLAAFARKRLAIPWVIRLPNINTRDYRNPARGWLSHWFNNQLIRRADALQVISPQLEAYVRSWPHPPRRIYCIPNGVDLGGYIRENQAQGVRERLRISGDAPVIGSMGRLDKIKGYDLLLHAYQKITQKIPEARLLLVGDGPERLPLAELAARLSLPHPVIFTGYTEDVKPYLAVLSLFVCSSRSEGVPHSLLEAMAMGLPIVSTRVGGIESVMEDRREGWLIPAEDVDALSSAVLELLSCPGTAQTCAQAARARVEQEFSLRRMVEQVQTMYRELIG